MTYKVRIELSQTLPTLDEALTRAAELHAYCQLGFPDVRQSVSIYEGHPGDGDPFGGTLVGGGVALAGQQQTAPEPAPPAESAQGNRSKSRVRRLKAQDAPADVIAAAEPPGPEEGAPRAAAVQATLREWVHELGVLEGPGGASGEPATPPAEPAPAVGPAVVTIEQLRALAAPLVHQGKTEGIKSLLRQVGADSVSAVPADRRAEVLAGLEQMKLVG